MKARILNMGQNLHVRGGSDRYLLSLTDLLSERGHTVVPFAAAHEENRVTPWSEYYPPGVDTRNPGAGDLLRFFYNIPARKQLKRLLREVEPDLAHLHIYYGQLSSSILEPLDTAELPVVQSLHDYKLACPVSTFVSGNEVCEACGGVAFWNAALKRCNRGSFLRSVGSALEAYMSRACGDLDRVDHFIAVSEFLRRKMVEHDLIPEDRISTIHNFVDPDRFEPSYETGAHLLYFGRINSVKGLGTLLDAVTPLEHVKLIVAGAGPEEASLRERIARDGLSHVEFVGFQSGTALRDLVRHARAIVVPSRWYENCPMSVLETMAWARPVVGSDIGGIPELIRDGVDGLLVAPGDADALRESLDWMMQHPAAAQHMGCSARRRVENEFSPSKHYEQLTGVYSDLLH